MSLWDGIKVKVVIMQQLLVEFPCQPVKGKRQEKRAMKLDVLCYWIWQKQLKPKVSKRETADDPDDVDDVASKWKTRNRGGL